MPVSVYRLEILGTPTVFYAMIDLDVQNWSQETGVQSFESLGRQWTETNFSLNLSFRFLLDSDKCCSQEAKQQLAPARVAKNKSTFFY